MKIAVFADIHGNIEALRAICSDCNNKQIDTIISLGDNIGIGPFPNECITYLRNSNVQVINGNHEITALTNRMGRNYAFEIEIKHFDWTRSTLDKESLNFISQCPISIEKNLGSYKLLFTHFAYDQTRQQYKHSGKIIKENALQIFSKEEYGKNNYIFFGHEHIAHQAVIETQHFIDIGSSGCIYTDKTYYTTISLNDGKIVIEKVEIPYDRKKLIEETKKIIYPNHIHLLKEFYDIDENIETT